MRKKIMWSLIGVAVVILGFAGYYAYSFWSFADKISTDSGESRFHFPKMTNTAKGSESLAPPKWEGKERVNILLLGGDSRGLQANEIPRSDSIMIASLDPVSKKSYLFSILRDTYVKIPNNGMDRINTAISTGGPELAMKTVSNLMGIPIQYYVYTDFKGFIALVDALDGIDLEVEKDMRYTDAADNHEYDINLKKGFQHLNGKTALQYVRFRHDATSDFTRTERQRKFMKAVAEKLQSTTSLIKLPKILSSIDPYIETNLSVTQMLKLASLGFEVKTDGMVSQQIPPQDLLEEKVVGGAQVLGIDPAKLQPFIKELFGEPAATSHPASGSGKLSLGAETGVINGGAAPSKVPAAATKKPVTTPKPTVQATPKPTVKPAATTETKTGEEPVKSSAAPSPAATKAPAASPKASAGTSAGTGSAKPAAGAATPAPTPKASAGTANP